MTCEFYRDSRGQAQNFADILPTCTPKVRQEVYLSILKLQCSAMRKPHRTVEIGILLLTFVLASGHANADESLAISGLQVNTDSFAMDTAVYFGDETQPSVRTTTVFLDRKAYDEVAGKDGAIAHFDFDSKVIQLLDTTKTRKTTIGFDEILRFQAQQSAKAQRREGLGTFLANPRFIREFDAGSSTIKLSSPWLSYQAKGAQSSAGSVEQFVEFADWSARLSSMMNPQAPPPQARMELNAALKKHGWQVSRITRTGGPRARRLGVVHSDHTYRDQLTERDQDLIHRAENGLKNFKEISFSEYLKLRNSSDLALKK